MTAPLLRVEDLKVHFPIRGGWLGRTVGAVKAVDGILTESAPARPSPSSAKAAAASRPPATPFSASVKATSGRILFEGTSIS